MVKITETGSTIETDPSNYIGYEVGEDGKRKKKEKEMKDKELHKSEPPDGPKPPSINVQAEAYKKGFSIGLVLEGAPIDISETSIKAMSAFPLRTLNYIHHVCETYSQAKLVFEDTTTGEKGYVTPAMFVKVYSKMLVSEQDKKKEQAVPMSESYNSKHANLPLANELMNIGLVNNVKGTAKVLREENPMRKAMEIYYASEKANANTDEKKADYVPSQLKEGKMVFEKATKPSGASTDTSSDTASKTATKTATKTSTDAYTQGNVTVTGGAGAGATSVTISIPRGDGGDPAQRAVDAKPKPTKSSKKQEEEVTPKPKRLIIW